MQKNECIWCGEHIRFSITTWERSDGASFNDCYAFSADRYHRGYVRGNSCNGLPLPVIVLRARDAPHTVRSGSNARRGRAARPPTGLPGWP